MVYRPAVGISLPPDNFNSLIGNLGQRAGWLRSHACPCVWNASPTPGRLATPGAAQRACKTCLGIGIYWDAPSLPFSVGMTFRSGHNFTPVEPGVMMHDWFGMTQSSEPSMTIPYWNPYLDPSDPQQSTDAWNYASVDDMFVPVDMLARYTAVLQVGGQEILPFQQNLQIAPSGAVTIWDGPTQTVLPVSSYTVSGAQVTITGYPAGTGYMVEFQAAALFVAFRRAGAIPHSRPFGAGSVNEPRVFHVQALDFWTRQRGIQPVVNVGGSTLQMAVN